MIIQENYGNRYPNAPMVEFLDFCKEIENSESNKDILRLKLNQNNNNQHFQNYLINSFRINTKPFSEIIYNDFYQNLDDRLSKTGKRNCREVFTKLKEQISNLFLNEKNGVEKLCTMIDPKEKGGVKAFFEYIFNFKSGDNIRNGVWESPGASAQCESIYKKVGLNMEKTDKDKIYWKKIDSNSLPTEKDKVTCYICEADLRHKNPDLGNAIQCEHFFPFLEAQLFWCLHLNSLVVSQKLNLPENFLEICKREYGSVCRKCNCNPYKGGKPILKYNKNNDNWEINEDTINSIVGEGTRGSDIPPKPKLNKTERRKRLEDVFKPLVETVNNYMPHTPKEKLELLLYKYFLYVDTNCYNKLIKVFTKGEDLNKLQKIRNNALKAIKKAKKKMTKFGKTAMNWLKDGLKLSTKAKKRQENLQDTLERSQKSDRNSSRTSSNLDSKLEEINAIIENQEKLKSEVEKYHKVLGEFRENVAPTAEQKQKLTKAAGEIKILQDAASSVKIGGGYPSVNTDLNNINWDEIYYNSFISKESLGAIHSIKIDRKFSKSLDLLIIDTKLECLKEIMKYFNDIISGNETPTYTKYIEMKMTDADNKINELLKKKLDQLWNSLFEIFKKTVIPNKSPINPKNFKSFKILFFETPVDPSELEKKRINRTFITIKKSKHNIQSSIYNNMLDWFSHFYLERNSGINSKSLTDSVNLPQNEILNKTNNSINVPPPPTTVTTSGNMSLGKGSFLNSEKETPLRRSKTKVRKPNNKFDNWMNQIESLSKQINLKDKKLGVLIFDKQMDIIIISGEVQEVIYIPKKKTGLLVINRTKGTENINIGLDNGKQTDNWNEYLEIQCCDGSNPINKSCIQFGNMSMLTEKCKSLGLKIPKPGLFSKTYQHKKKRPVSRNEETGITTFQHSLEHIKKKGGRTRKKKRRKKKTKHRRKRKYIKKTKGKKRRKKKRTLRK
jgi:hypothetical protein